MKHVGSGKRSLTKAQIKASIDAAPEHVPYDPENPPWTDADFKNAVVTRSREELKAWIAKRKPGERGRQKAPTKVQVALRLDRDLLESLRATGPGWQSRINDALREMLKLMRGS